MMPGMPKILQLRSHAGFFGVERLVLELTQALEVLGYQMTVGIIENSSHPSHEFYRVATKMGLPVHRFKSQGAVDLNTLRALKSIVTAKEIDIIHSHGYKADIYAWLIKNHTQCKIISTCHPWLGTEHWKARFYMKLDKFILSRFDRVVAISDDIKLACQWGPLKRKAISVINNGIDPARVQSVPAHTLRQQLAISQHEQVIGTIGRLSPEKGHKILVDAFAAIDVHKAGPCRLILVGDGPEKDPLMEQCHHNGVNDRVLFAGTQTDIALWLNIMDVFVLPSLSEGLPLALMEAMAAGKAAIASSVGDIPMIFDQNRYGYGVPPGDVTALTEALNFFLTRPNQRNHLAARAKSRIQNVYSHVQMAKQYDKLYQRMTITNSSAHLTNHETS